MNSEELEMSLRTEFEIHLKDVYADMRQELSEFQEKIETEFEKHRSHLDTAFQEFSARLSTSRELDAGFKDSVFEHLRLARDEGARITAMAIAEAEEMAKQSEPVSSLSVLPAAPPSAGLIELRDAINEITAQDSQGTILKALVQHAAQFTPRGAFFIIKNEQFVGWRVFNKEGDADEDAVREIQIPVAAETVLGESVRSLSAVESSFGTYDHDAEYLDQLGFGEPERMFAIPLVARGRGVAVLYADFGNEGEQVNVEALETLVRVAGLTVEVLASSQASKPVQESQPAVVYSVPAEEKIETTFEAEQNVHTEELSDEMTASEETAVMDPDDSAMDYVSQPEEVQEYEYSSETVEEHVFEEKGDFVEEAITGAQEISVEPEQEVEEVYSPEETTETEKYGNLPDEYPAHTTTDFQFTESQNTDFESKPFEPVQEISAKAESFEAVEDVFVKAEPFETAGNFSAKDESLDSFEIAKGSQAVFVPEPAVVKTVPAPAAPIKSRFSDRNVDLPIEVSEDERRLHNDARRFARLLVSEIKLYNEQKVKEGREAHDLYERLREAIDRSRDMYDKRVQPPVAARFDYFHYELVSTLAEGEAKNLGGGYPGAIS